MFRKILFFFSSFGLLFLFCNFVNLHCDSLDDVNKEVIMQDSTDLDDLDQELAEFFKNTDSDQIIDFSNSSSEESKSLKNKIDILISFMKLKDIPLKHKLLFIFNTLKDSASSNIREHKNWYIALAVVLGAITISGGIYYYA